MQGCGPLTKTSVTLSCRWLEAVPTLGPVIKTATKSSDLPTYVQAQQFMVSECLKDLIASFSADRNR